MSRRENVKVGESGSANGRKRKRTNGDKKGGWFKKKYNGTAINSLRGSAGFMITCVQGKERLATKEATTVLLDIIQDERAGETQPQNQSRNSEDLSELISKEVSNLKESEAVLKAVDDNGKGLLFLKLKETMKIDPVLIAKILIRGLQQSKKSTSTCCLRVVPLQRVCATTKHDINANLEEMFHSYFNDFKNASCTYGIQFKKRNTESLDRDEIISLVGDTFHKIAKKCNIEIEANLKQPEMTILIEVYKSIAGLSIVKDMAQLGKFNVRTAVA